MKKHPLVSMDTKDDRREIWSCLHRLSPKDRMRFLDWCCLSCNNVRPQYRKMKDRYEGAYRNDAYDNALTNEIYTDFWMLTCQWDLDAEYAARVLERFVKTGDLPPPSAVSSCSSLPVSTRTSCKTSNG